MTSESLSKPGWHSQIGATAPLTPPDLSLRVVHERPFHYATFRECLPTRPGQEVLGWLESDAPWRLKRTEFYEQYEFSCWDCTSPIASYVTSPTTLDAVRTTMTEMFGRNFENSISVVAHKLFGGQRIGIHNDYLAGQETHRLVIQLNQGLSDDDGGFLMLFNSDNPADIHRVMRPVHLSGFAFEISPSSFHAVSQVHGGVRYSLIYSLCALPD
jgi:hypothetical protein